MIVNHTHQLMTKTQRAFKRKNVNESCVFYSAKFKKDEKGEKYAEIGQKEYTAKLMNISGGGCCMISGGGLAQSTPTMTLVALTTARAGLPDSRPSSSTALLEMVAEMI